MSDIELSPGIKTFIVQELACFDTPATVVASVKEIYGLAITRQCVQTCDPTKAAGKQLGEELKQVFQATRAKFLDDVSAIGIAHKMVRLRKLVRILQRAEERGAHVIVMQALEQAAKEIGGAFTNRQQIEHSGKIETPPAAVVNLTVSGKPWQRSDKSVQRYTSAAEPVGSSGLMS